MTLLKDNNYKDINVALLSLEADIKKLSNNGSFDTSVIDKQLAEINSRIDKINAGSNNTSAEINDIRTEIENINSKLIGNSVRIENIEQKLSDIFSAENKVTDFNATTNSGIYYWKADSMYRPGTGYGVLLVNKYDDGSESNWVNQIAYGTNNKIYFRQNINSGNWTEWKAVAFEGETKANFLDEYVGAGGTRLTSGNIVPKDSSEYGGMRKDVVTDSMTDSGRPGHDGHLLTMFWDNSGRYDTQFFVSNNNSNEEPLTVKARTKANGEDYGPWVDVITSNNIGSQSVARAGSAGTADSLFYRHGNEINFKGGTPNQCWFNYRNADTGGPSPVDTMQYIFCNYSGDTSKSVLVAGTAKTSSKLVIPIGAPSSLEDGCIWIER